MAAAKKADLLKGFTRPGAAENWHFLTGDADSIQKVTQAAGYRYAYDSNTGQYIHASGVMVVTPDGKMSHYFYGIEFAGRDMQLGLVEASSGKIGSVADQVLLYCFHYDPQTGKYGLVIMNVIRLFGTGTALVLVGAILIYLRRERRQRRTAS
jgi:protein SCO1/2